MHRALQLLLGACLAATLCRAEPQPLVGVAAVVNTETITWTQVDEMLRRERPDGGAADATRRRAALNELVEHQLVLQEFKKLDRGCGIPRDAVIDRHVATIVREQFAGDAAAFKRSLESQGRTLEQFKQAEWEKVIVHAMLSQAFRTAKLGAVTEERTQAYYERYEYAKPLAEVREEIVKALAEEDRQKARQAWIAKLRKKAYIKTYPEE